MGTKKIQGPFVRKEKLRQFIRIGKKGVSGRPLCEYLLVIIQSRL
jgi:hypothetical protein